MTLNQLFRRALLSASLVLSISLPALAQTDYTVSGNAYKVGTTTLLYREYYSALDANREVRVNYAKPDGQIFATKLLRYVGEVSQPEFELVDSRTLERRAARFDSGRLIVNYDKDGLKQEKEILETLNVIMDSGLDAFVQQNWDKLLSGKKVSFSQLVPQKLDTVKLQVKQIAPAKSPLATAQAPQTWKYFVVEPANKVSAIFAPPVHLAYEVDGKYLMRFQGRAPVTNDKGGNWDVRVEYEYW